MAIRVVAMDDDADILRMVRIKLERAGFEVLTAANGGAGVKLVLAERPDVMIVDVMMPEKDGYQVLTEVKEKLGNDAPLAILLTARSEPADMAKGISCGASDFIVKPFSPRELIERVNLALIRIGKAPGSPKSI